jgi:hypothetical protein
VQYRSSAGHFLLLCQYADIESHEKFVGFAKGTIPRACRPVNFLSHISGSWHRLVLQPRLDFSRSSFTLPQSHDVKRSLADIQKRFKKSPIHANSASASIEDAVHLIQTDSHRTLGSEKRRPLPNLSILSFSAGACQILCVPLSILSDSPRDGRTFAHRLFSGEGDEVSTQKESP